jgi:hypothetical protein
VTPVGKRWANLIAGADVPEDKKAQLNADLELANELLFKYIHHSNFDLAISESYFDFVIGTAAIHISEGLTDDKPIICKSLSTINLAFEEDQNGFLSTIFHHYKNVKAEEIKALWPDAVIPENMAITINDKPQSTFDFLEAFVTDPITNITRYTVQLNNDFDILVDRELPVLPVVAFRWSKLNGETFGRGPVLEALPTIKSLNEMLEIDLKGFAISTLPPFLVNGDGLLNPYTIQLEPLSLIPISPLANNQMPIQQLPVTQNYQAQFAHIQDFRQQIKEMLFDMPLRPVDAPPQTATEIIQRQQVLEEEMSPAFERLQIEFLPRLLNRIIYILRKKGLFPNLAIDGKTIAVEYNSPLSLSQGREDVKNFTDFYGTLAQIAGPQMSLMALKAEKVPEWLATKFGVDMNLINLEDDLTDLGEQLQQQAQQQQPQQQSPTLPSEPPLVAAPQGQAT